MFEYIQPDQVILLLHRRDGLSKLCYLHNNIAGWHDPDSGERPAYILHCNGSVHSYVSETDVQALSQAGQIVVCYKDGERRTYTVPEASRV